MRQEEPKDLLPLLRSLNHTQRKVLYRKLKLRVLRKKVRKSFIRFFDEKLGLRPNIRKR